MRATARASLNDLGRDRRSWRDSDEIRSARLL